MDEKNFGINNTFSMAGECFEQVEKTIAQMYLLSTKYQKSV